MESLRSPHSWALCLKEAPMVNDAKANIVLPSIQVSGEAFVVQASEAIDRSTNIPPEAKAEIKEFLQEKSQEIIEFVGDINDFLVPTEISEWWPIVVEILNGLMG
jgi:hypothetical protein